MKRIFSILLCALIPSFVFADPPDWTVPGGFEQSMSIVCQVLINNVSESDPNNMVGAFVSDEVRGVSQGGFFNNGSGLFVAVVTVAGDIGEEVDFQLYDASSDAILSIQERVVFQNDGYGTPSEPHEFNVVSGETVPPTADFTVDKTSGNAPLTVQFTDQSIQGTNPISSWSWDFDGDGTEDGSGQGPQTYIYESAGAYVATLTVSDGTLSDNASQTITVIISQIGTIPEGSTDPVDFEETDTTIQFTTGNSGDIDIEVTLDPSEPSGEPPSGVGNIAPQIWSIDVSSGDVDGEYCIEFEFELAGLDYPTILKRDNQAFSWENLNMLEDITITVGNSLIRVCGLTSFSDFAIGHTARCDLNADGHIDVKDVQEVIRGWIESQNE